MSSVLRQLGRPALVSLAQALEAERLKPSFSSGQLRGQVPEELLEPVHAELKEMLADGMGPPHIARLLRLLADEREAAQDIADRVELVWSGLDLETSTTRDTEVVVQQLFREAKLSVLVASYAVDKGKKAESLFGHLAERMDDEPDLEVRFFLTAQERNIEAGVMIADASLARALKAQFDTLVDRGALRRVPGL